MSADVGGTVGGTRMRRAELPWTFETIARIANATGIKVSLEPHSLEAAQLQFPNGRYAYFRFGNLDVNLSGSADIARDKRVCAHFLVEAGLPVPTSFAVPRDSADAFILGGQLEAFAARHDWPLVVKPNSLYEGRGVERVDNVTALRRAVAVALRMDKLCLVQPFYQGHDVRVVIFDGDVVAAYARVPPAVVGDGRRAIGALLDAYLDDHGDGLPERFNPAEAWLRFERRDGGLARVPAAGEPISLIDAASGALGASRVDLTDTIPSELLAIGVTAARVTGLRLVGIDMIVDLPAVELGLLATAEKAADVASTTSGRTVVLEVNAAPELEGVAALGPERQSAVDRLFAQILSELGDRYDAGPPTATRRTDQVMGSPEALPPMSGRGR